MSERIKDMIVTSHYWICNALSDVVQFILFKKIKADSIHSILVFRSGSIGDNICAMPALSVIRNNFPDARIDILTNPGE